MEEIPDKLFYKIGEVCQYTDTQPYVLRFWESEFPQLAAKKSRSGQRVYGREDIDLVLRIKKLLYEEEYTIAGARKRLEQELSGEPIEDDEDSREKRGHEAVAPPSLFERVEARAEEEVAAAEPDDTAIAPEEESDVEAPERSAAVRALETPRAPGREPASIDEFLPAPHTAPPIAEPRDEVRAEEAAPAAPREAEPAPPAPRAAPPQPPSAPEAETYRKRYERALTEIAELRLQLADMEERRLKVEAALADSRQALARRREGAERAASRLEELLASIAPEPVETEEAPPAP